MGCKHIKVYSNTMLMSYPPKKPWICSECGERGQDTQHIAQEVSYDEIVKKFENQKLD